MYQIMELHFETRPFTRVKQQNDVFHLTLSALIVVPLPLNEIE